MSPMQLLKVAVTSSLLLPLAATAVTGTKQEHRGNAGAIVLEGATGRDLAIQVASTNAHGVRGEREHGSPAAAKPTGQPWIGVDHRKDHGSSSPAPVPEPSSLLLFASSLLVARAVTKRAGA